MSDSSVGYISYIYLAPIFLVSSIFYKINFLPSSKPLVIIVYLQIAGRKSVQVCNNGSIITSI